MSPAATPACPSSRQHSVLGGWLELSIQFFRSEHCHAVLKSIFRDFRPQSRRPLLGAPHLTFWAPAQCRFCLAERGHDGSRGLQPADRWETEPRRVATPESALGREINLSSVAPRRGAIFPPPRGLKPTATITQSLRDCSKTEMRPTGYRLLELGGLFQEAPSSLACFALTYRSNIQDRKSSANSSLSVICL